MEEEGREIGRSSWMRLEGRRESADAWRMEWGGGSIECEVVEKGMKAACSCEGEMAKRG